MKTSHFLGVRAIDYKSKVNGNHNFCYVKTVVCHRKETEQRQVEGVGEERERLNPSRTEPPGLVPGSKAAHFFLKLLLQTLC